MSNNETYLICYIWIDYNRVCCNCFYFLCYKINILFYEHIRNENIPKVEQKHWDFCPRLYGFYYFNLCLPVTIRSTFRPTEFYNMFIYSEKHSFDFLLFQKMFLFLAPMYKYLPSKYVIFGVSAFCNFLVFLFLWKYHFMKNEKKLRW